MIADTTLLIDFLRNKQPAISAISGILPSRLCTTEINVFELVVGVYHSKQHVQDHLAKLFTLLSRMTILPLTRKGTLKAGEIAGMLLSKGIPVEDSDCLIAGIAISHGETEIITANKDHFNRIPGISVKSF